MEHQRRDSFNFFLNPQGIAEYKIYPTLFSSSGYGKHNIAIAQNKIILF